MYIDELKRKAKIGKVSIDVKNGRAIRIRFTYPKGKRNKLYAGTVTEKNWREAIKTATIIDGDISTNNYDFTLTRYKLKQAQVIEVVEKLPNLSDIWNNYSSVNKDRVAPTTIKSHWKLYEKHYLGETPTELLEINKANEFVAHLLTRYTSGSLAPRFSNCLNPSVNLAVKTRKIKYNPYKDPSELTIEDKEILKSQYISYHADTDEEKLQLVQTMQQLHDYINSLAILYRY